MKKNQVTIGNVYTAKVSGNLARVRITGESSQGGWWGVNLDTNRKVRIKTAGRLHRQIADPDAPAAGGEPATAPETIPTEQEMPEAQEQRAASDKPTSEDEQALEPQAEEEPQVAPEAPQAADTPPEQPTPDQEPEAHPDAPSGDDAPQDAAPEPTDAPQETRLSKLTVPELKALHIEVVGRPSSSSNSRYLQWRIHQARKGRIPTGPARQRSAGVAGPHKVLPRRMDEAQVAELDQARKRLSLPSRMELFRRSLHAFLLEAGEVRAAELFAPTPEA